jgi:hypothetical protein
MPPQITPDIRFSRSHSLTATLMMAFSLLGTPARAAILEVPDDFATIQAAINAASDGDEILVDIGTYTENIELREGINVVGFETARTFITANDNTLATVDANNIDNVLFSNFTFTNSNFGVLVANSTNILLTNTVFDSLGDAAVTIGALSDVDITNNVFWRNNIAIARLTTDAKVENNIFIENTVTITSNVIDPNIDVSYNCFYLNDDLSSGTGTLGTNFQTGNPLLVDTSAKDLHLQQSSPCIDTGTGTDIIDNTVADIGAYGGQDADRLPFPVVGLAATDTSTTGPDVFNIKLDWDANLAYLVTNTVMPGSYRVWYKLGQPDPPFDYDGTDAGNGTEPSPIDVGDITTYTLSDLQPDTATPGVPVLVSTSPQNESVTLFWNAATGASGYRVYYGEVLVTENTEDVGNVTKFTVTGLTNLTEYVFAVSALAQPVYYLNITAADSTPAQNESDFATEINIAIGNPIEGSLSNELTGTPEEVTPNPNLPDDGCFIATAAFGADWVREVKVLRDFRDRYLLTHAPGRWFVNWYYTYGPTAAQYLNEHTQLKPLVRAALWPLVVLAAFMLSASLTTQLSVLALTLLLISILYRASAGLRRRAD